MNDVESLSLEAQQQIALTYALRDIAAALSSTLDLNEVLDLILANIRRVVAHDAATILLVENGVAYVARETGYAQRGLSEWARAQRLSVTDTPNLKFMAETGQPYHISNTRTDPSWVPLHEVAWLHSYAGAPIIYQDRLIGFIDAESETDNFYTQSHAEALLAFAHQAAIAIENARLFQESRRRLRAQTALLNAIQTLSSSLDLPTVLQRCAEQLCFAIDATSVYICYWNKADHSTVVVAEYYGPDASDREREPTAYEPDYNDEIDWLQTGQPLIRHADDLTTPASTREHMLKYGAYSLLDVPLIAKNTTFGYASLWETRRRRNFTPDEIELCLGIARQAAIAFDNALLFDESRRQLAVSRTLQAMGALITSQMSLNDVYERIFDLLAEVIHYDGVSIELFDETDRVQLAAQRGFPDPELTRHTSQEVTGSSRRERWGQHSVIVLPDVSCDARWMKVPGFEFIRATIIAWLRVKQTTFGTLMVVSRAANAYDETSGQTVAAFANQAAIAIENARLSEAIRHYAVQLEQRVANRTAELERARHRLQAILDAAGEGVIFTDSQGVVEYMNPAMEELTGYTAAEARGKTARLWKSDLNQTTLYQDMWATILRSEIWKGELINRRKNGALYEAALTIAPLLDLDDQIVGYVGIQRDVSQQKEVERLKDQFVSNVSHEFRAPLANIKLYLSLLERGRPEKRGEYLQTLQRETTRLEDLIEDLLYLSRLDTGTGAMKLAPIDVHSLLAQIIADRSTLAAERGLVLDYLPQLNLPLALADASLLVHVVSNLMGNAINYTPAGGLITISAQARPWDDRSWITVTVQDTGPGISPQDLPHIFERFYRGEVGRRSGLPGTGLGLPICKQVAEQMEGRLTVLSTPGHGAAFTVWLKMAQSSQPALARR